MCRNTDTYPQSARMLYKHSDLRGSTQVSRPFIPAPNCASVELIFLLNGEVVENTFHVRKGSPYSASDLSALRAIFDTWHSAHYKTAQGPAASLYRIRSKALDAVGSPIEDYFLPTPRAGTESGTNLPNNVTMAFKLSTGLAGRSYRGRIYVVGCTAVNFGVDSAHMSSAALA